MFYFFYVWKCLHYSSLTHCNARVGVGSLHKLFALVSDHPVGIDLRGSLGVEVNHLKLPEVCDTNGTVFRARVKDIRDIVIIKVILTGVTTTITWEKI